MSASELNWTPILDGARRERALDIAGDIAADLRIHFDGLAAVAGREAWSLAQGRSGVALFFAYLGEALSDDTALATAARLAEEALQGAAGVAPMARFFEGFAGVAWTLAHFDGWLFELEGDPTDAIGGALLDLVAASSWDGEYDLLAGLAGLGVYALERLPRPCAIDLLSAVVERLSELADREPRYSFWWTPAGRLPPPVMQDFPDGAWNLGVAHGVPGVIALLAKACGVGVATGTAWPLLNKAVDWLLTQRLPVEAGTSFSAFVAPGVVAGPARSACCYGDPGVAASGAHLQSPVPIHRFGPLQGVAERWLEHVMASCRTGAGLGGFASVGAGGQLKGRPGFLDGAAGIGLVLLAAATPLESRWDRLYLVS
jgi:hypothetical protein